MLRLISDRRFQLLALALIVLTALFWLSSRYPALDSKAMMAGSITMADGLSFNAKIQHQPQESFTTQVSLSFLNWLYSNRQGMLFGLAFAWLFMTMMPLVIEHVKNTTQGALGSIVGLLLGAPLGVCVNCAAPIAYGLYRRGASIETASAIMISSPVFNIVVLSMLFSLFPWPIVAIKLAATLVIIIVVIPLLSKIFPQETFCNITENEQLAAELTSADAGIQRPSTLTWLLTGLATNAKLLLVKIIPIMLLAGLIGAVAINLLPIDHLSLWLAQHQGADSLVILLALSFFGLLLPAPIAFDVIICATLYNAGVPLVAVATLLFTLGSFSIYSFFVLWQAGAKRIACVLWLMLVLLGLIVGLLSDHANQVYQNYHEHQLYSSIAAAGAIRHQPLVPTPKHTSLQSPPLMTYAPTSMANVEQLPLIKTPSNKQTWQFLPTQNIGLKTHPKALIDLMTTPFNHSNSIASGDINNDNWVDLVIASSEGLFIYTNIGGAFQLTHHLFKAVLNKPLGSLGLVDLNNDGWLDIFINKAHDGSYISYSHNGQYKALTPLDNPSPALISRAVAFGDLDKNGELDIVLGQHNGLAWRLLSDERSAPLLLNFHQGMIKTRHLNNSIGETLSILISDLNHDTNPEVFIGNDFDEPDAYFWGTDTGELTPWPNDFVTTSSTMSIDTADINNDLTLESFHAQITRNPASPPLLFPERSLIQSYKTQCTGAAASSQTCLLLSGRMASIPRSTPNKCMSLSLLAGLQSDCLAAHRYRLAIKNPQAHGADIFNTLYPHYATQYRQVFSTPVGAANKRGMKQKIARNLLYKYDPSPHGTPNPTELAERMGLHITGWAWNARFADVDGDSWQDIFIANGYTMRASDQSNRWYKNIGGTHFEDQTAAAHLGDFDPTTASTYIDYDNDGDLDLITFSPTGLLKTYTNHNSPNHHLQIELQDHQGNRFGIGSRISIFYDGDHQMREVKASGGYLSQDSAIQHFGLGVHHRVDKIQVEWSTGGISEFEGYFYSGNRYRLTRPYPYTTDKIINH